MKHDCKNCGYDSDRFKSARDVRLLDCEGGYAETVTACCDKCEDAINTLNDEDNSRARANGGVYV